MSVLTVDTSIVHNGNGHHVDILAVEVQHEYFPTLSSPEIREKLLKGPAGSSINPEVMAQNGILCIVPLDQIRNIGTLPVDPATVADQLVQAKMYTQYFPSRCGQAEPVNIISTTDGLYVVDGNHRTVMQREIAKIDGSTEPTVYAYVFLGNMRDVFEHICVAAVTHRKVHPARIAIMIHDYWPNDIDFQTALDLYNQSRSNVTLVLNDEQVQAVSDVSRVVEVFGTDMGNFQRYLKIVEHLDISLIPLILPNASGLDGRMQVGVAELLADRLIGDNDGQKLVWEKLVAHTKEGNKGLKIGTAQKFILEYETQKAGTAPLPAKVVRGANGTGTQQKAAEDRVGAMAIGLDKHVRSGGNGSVKPSDQHMVVDVERDDALSKARSRIVDLERDNMSLAGKAKVLRAALSRIKISSEGGDGVELNSISEARNEIIEYASTAAFLEFSINLLNQGQNLELFNQLYGLQNTVRSCVLRIAQNHMAAELNSVGVGVWVSSVMDYMCSYVHLRCLATGKELDMKRLKRDFTRIEMMLSDKRVKAKFASNLTNEIDALISAGIEP